MNSLLTKRTYNSFGWFICALGALFYCYEYFLRIMPSVMTSELMHAFQINATLLGNLAAFYYYAYTPMQIPVGLLMDKYGPRRLMIFAIQICGIGVLLFGVGGHLYLAYLGRFLVGFGSAFAFVGVLKLACLWVPLRFLGFVSGAATTLGMIGAMFGSIFLEKVVRVSGWNTTISIAVLGALILAIIIGLSMPGERRAPGHVVAAHTEAPPMSFQQLFANLWQLCKHPVIWLNGFVGSMLYLPLSVFAELWGPKYLEIAHHIPQEDAVRTSIIVFAAWAIGGPLIGYLARNDFRRSIYFLMIGALITVASSTFLLLVGNMSYRCLELTLFIFGFGSSAQILIFNVGCLVSDKDYAGTAIAFTNMLVMLGGSLFEPFVGGVLDFFWRGEYLSGIKVYTPQAFNIGLSILPIGALLAFFALFLMLRFKPTTETFENQ